MFLAMSPRTPVCRLSSSSCFFGNKLARAATNAATPKLPDYLVDVYTWAYVAPRMVELLDRELVVATILWCQQNFPLCSTWKAMRAKA